MTATERAAQELQALREVQREMQSRLDETPKGWSTARKYRYSLLEAWRDLFEGQVQSLVECDEIYQMTEECRRWLYSTRNLEQKDKESVLDALRSVDDLLNKVVQRLGG